MKNEFDYLNDVKMDFSIYDEESITETESIKMKNKKSFKKPCLIAACVTVIALTGTAFASGFVSNVIRTFTTGHNKFIVTDNSAPQQLPEVLKGKLYDKDGNMLTCIKYDADGEYLNELFDADGNKLTPEDIKKIYIDAYGDELVEISFAGEEDDSAKTVYKTIEEAEAGVSFDIKVPSYMPEGYSLDSVECYNNNEGEPSGDYRTLIYKNTNGNIIYFFERLINDETAFEAGGSEKMEEIKINGRTAVIDGTSSLDWETADDVSVGIAVHDDTVTRDELIKIGENTK